MKHEIKLLPFKVPTHAYQVMPPGRRQDGWKEAPKYHVSELSKETLTGLCDEFRDKVFAIAAEGRENK